MRVFITGIAGFLGSHIAEALAEDGHAVSGCDDLSGGDPRNVPPGVLWTERRCQDLTPEMLEGIDIVYHCAALAHEGLSVFSPKTITDSIYGASVSVFTAAAAAGVRRIVYTSSMSRYGDNPIPFHEDMPPRPQDPYAISKVAAEDTLKLLSKVHGFEYVIVVPHNIIGERQNYTDPFRNVASIMINLLLQGREPVVYGGGTQARCFSDIRDVVPCMILAGFQENLAGETINIGPDEEFVTIKHLAMTLCEMIDPEREIRYFPARPCEVLHATCSADKARKLLGYETKHTLNATLRRMVNWIDAKGPRPFNYHIPIEIPSATCPETWMERLF